jgi:hypothetical protein
MTYFESSPNEKLSIRCEKFDSFKNGFFIKSMKSKFSNMFIKMNHTITGKHVYHVSMIAEKRHRSK